MKIFIIRTYWKIRIFFYALLWIPQVNLGDEVKYKGSIHMVINGTRPNSWRLADLNNSDSGWVNRNECKKIFTIKNMVRSFKSGYSFYSSAWLDIWVREGVKPWMKALRIWPWPFNKN